MNPKVVRPPPKNKLSLRIREIAKSKLFIQFILFVTLLNTILFMLYWHRQPAAMKTSLGLKLMINLSKIIFLF